MIRPALGPVSISRNRLTEILAVSNRRRAEIEQLRGELDRLSDHYQGLMRECDAKDAEIGRLRAAGLELAALSAMESVKLEDAERERDDLRAALDGMVGEAELRIVGLTGGMPVAKRADYLNANPVLLAARIALGRQKTELEAS